MSNGEETVEEVKGEVFKEKVPQVEALQFDGENGEDIVKYLGGEDYGKVSGKTVELSLQGKDPRSQKVVVERGQWVVKTLTATVVVNEGEFAGKYTKEDGSPVEALEPEELPEPVPEEELVYQPGFAPPAAEGEEKPPSPEPEPQQG
jgi:hypothetical protein